ncbi:MAG TPA: alpha/beta fold hydrolase [Rhizomicrobium sp.]|nr:alpha/beta fold hydrolase [Rhizomicrobium sp.]
MASFVSGGLTLAYDEIGDPKSGRPVILIHGFASNRNENWRRLGWYGTFERKGMRFAAFDARGHGESAKPHDAAAYARDAMVGDVFALMDHLGAERADLLGYSMGARVALAAALANAARVPMAILGGIGGKLLEPGPAGTPLADAMDADDPATISEPLLKSFRQFADEQGEDRRALAACARAAHAPFSRQMLAGLPTRVLVVAGARDELAGDPAVLADAIPGARAVTLPGCDHFSAIAHGLFKASAIDFLDGVLE